MKETIIHGKAEIPDFDTQGNLPVGTHLASIDEVVTKFRRTKDTNDPFSVLLREIYEVALSAGIHKIILAGSYVTGQQRTCNDLDGFFYGPDTADWRKLEKYCFGNNVPLLGIRCDFFIVTSTDSYRHFVELFQSGRSGSKRGLVEIPILSSFAATANFSPFFLDSMIDLQIVMTEKKLNSSCDHLERQFFESRLAELRKTKERCGVEDFYKQCLLTEVSKPGASGKGDIQINTLISMIMNQTPVNIADYGCAKGRLISELNTLDSNFLSGLTYLGFDFKPGLMDTILTETGFSKKCAACKVAEYSEIDKNAGAADYVFVANVIHEVSLNDFAKVVSQAFSLAKVGGLVVFHDMEHVVFGESSFLPWLGEDMKEILCKQGVQCSLRKHESKSSVPLYTVIAHVNEEINFSDRHLTQKAREILLARVDSLIAERVKVVKNAQNEREYAYCSVSIANAMEQLHSAKTLL